MIDRFVAVLEQRGGGLDHAGGDHVDRNDVQGRAMAGDYVSMPLEGQINQRRRGVEALIPTGEREAQG